MEIVVSDESDIQKGVRRALLKLSNPKWSNPIKKGRSASIDVSPKKMDRWPLSREKMHAVADREGRACPRPAELPPDTPSRGWRENEQKATGVAEDVEQRGLRAPSAAT